MLLHHTHGGGLGYDVGKLPWVTMLENSTAYLYNTFCADIFLHAKIDAAVAYRDLIYEYKSLKTPRTVQKPHPK